MRPDPVPGSLLVPVIDHLLDAHAPGIAELLVGQRHADAREDIELNLTPHRLGVDEHAVHIEYAGLERPPHGGDATRSRSGEGSWPVCLVRVILRGRRDARRFGRLLLVVHPEDRPDHDHHVEHRLARIGLPPGGCPRVQVEPDEHREHHHDDGAQDDDADQSFRWPRSMRPTKRTGSQRTSATRSLRGMIALSVMWMCSGHTSVQHFVMLQ